MLTTHARRIARARFFPRPLVFAVAQALLCAPPALAQTIMLIDGSTNPTGTWSTGQWDLGGLPQTGDNVVVNATNLMTNNYDLLGAQLRTSSATPIHRSARRRE